jgi:hypothetical protein
MNVSPFLTSILSRPLPWVVLAGLFLGAAAMSASRRTGHRRDPERAHARKWVAACVLASIAVVFGLLAVFVPGPERIANVGFAWAAGVAAVVSFCALRFRKSLGIPVLVLLIAVGAFLGLFLRSIHAFTGETEIATVRAIAVTADSMRLELAPRGALPVLLTMDGVYFAPIVKAVIFDDVLVFLGAKTWYRFEGMNSFDESFTQVKTVYRFPGPFGVSERLWAFFEKNERRVPGVKTVQVGMDAKRPAAPRLDDVQPKEFATYSIRVQNDGGVEIINASR